SGSEGLECQGKLHGDRRELVGRGSVANGTQRIVAPAIELTVPGRAATLLPSGRDGPKLNSTDDLRWNDRTRRRSVSEEAKSAGAPTKRFVADRRAARMAVTGSDGCPMFCDHQRSLDLRRVNRTALRKSDGDCHAPGSMSDDESV